jgi:hypothetical protein
VYQLVLHPFAPLVFFSVALTAMLATYLVGGFAPSPTFEMLSTLSWALLLALWVVADARRRKQIPCYDFGFFCYLFLPVLVPGYCFWSRGWRGVLTLVAIATLWLMPYIVATMVWIALYG